MNTANGEIFTFQLIGYNFENGEIGWNYNKTKNGIPPFILGYHAPNSTLI